MKKVIFYNLTLSDCTPDREGVSRWCRRRGFKINCEIIDYNDRQPRLHALVKGKEPVAAIIVPSMSALAPNLKSLIAVILKLTRRGVRIHFIKERLILNRRHPVVSFMGFITTFEKDVRSIRGQRAALLNKLLSRPFGRPSKVTPAVEIEIKALKGRSLSLSEIARRVGLSRATVRSVLEARVS